MVEVIVRIEIVFPDADGSDTPGCGVQELDRLEEESHEWHLLDERNVVIEPLVFPDGSAAAPRRL